ncbi:MAG: cytochrome c [Chloroflexi bacterium]|nr:cytochrome c [Chloroflexota bacterium]
MKTASKVLVIVAFASLALTACGGSPTPTTPATTPPRTTATSTASPSVDAAGLYAASCAACHGANRQGVTGIGPALTAASLADETVDQVRATITNGRTGTAMPSFQGQLTTEQIQSLAEYLKSQP